MFRYTGKNRRSFSAVCHNEFGRKVIETTQTIIDERNIIDELRKALSTHRQNAIEIEYLDKYYRGDQPILYRKKEVRPEVNNKIVTNLAFFIVETKASEMAGEPIQYVLRGTDEEKSIEVNVLNDAMENEDKACDDIELCRWRSICGTAYRFIGKDDRKGSLLDDTNFFLTVENPMNTFVVYFADTKRPAFSCQIRKSADDTDLYYIYTNSKYFVIEGDLIVANGLNGNGAIPVVEYPNNARRLSDIEITISITDELNKMASDRSNGVEQFVASWVKFVNCEIDAETFHKMRDEGALVVKSNNGTDNKADVDILSSELNQSESQVTVDDEFEKLLIIQGMANRQGSSSGDTGGAVQLRNGFYSQEKRSELYEPIFKKSERQALRIILNRLRIDKGFKLSPSDVEIHISRTKMDNMLTKAEVLQILLSCGVKYERALKTVGIWSDPEQVAIESKDNMIRLYESEEINEEITQTDTDK